MKAGCLGILLLGGAFVFLVIVCAGSFTPARPPAAAPVAARDNRPAVYVPKNPEDERPPKEPSAATAPPEMTDTYAYALARDYIKTHLAAPASAEFPSIVWNGDAVKIARLPDGSISINSHVDAVNAFNAPTRQQFHIRMKPSSDTSAKCTYLQIGNDVLVNAAN